MCWSKRGGVSIVEILISNAAIGCSHTSMAAHHGQKECPQQSNSLLKGYSEFEDLIRTPGNTSKSAKSKKEGWQKVADQIKSIAVIAIKPLTWSLLYF